MGPVPHDLLPKSTVYEYFPQWRNGTWQRMMEALRTQVHQKQAPFQQPTLSAASVDSQSVPTAALDDAAVAPRVLEQLRGDTSKRLEVIWANNTYHNRRLEQWIETDAPGTWRLEVVQRPSDAKGFVLLPKRWVVERTFALSHAIFG
jgi:putative transposase